MAVGKMTNVRNLAFYHAGEIVATTKAEFNKKFPNVNSTTVLRSGKVTISKMLSNDKNPRVLSITWSEPLFVGDNGGLSTCPAVTYIAQSGEERIWYIRENGMHLLACVDVGIENLKNYESVLKKSRAK